MEELVSNFEQDIKFIIGHAGTGKSTKLVTMANKSTLVLTPTHKAAKVLIDKGIENVYTIHSTLSLVPTLNMEFRKKGNIQKLTKIGNTDLSSITEVFIDEFSMISQEILDQLLSVLPETANVTIFGDPYQLPPVSGTKIEPELYSNNIIKLTKQYRSSAPEVVSTFERFVTWLEIGGNSDLRVYTDRSSDLIKGDITSFNPTTDRVLAYTNKKVQQLNSLIHIHLGNTDELLVGDEISINGLNAIISDKTGIFTIFPKCIRKGKLLKLDELALASSKIQLDMKKYKTKLDYPKLNIEIEGEVYSIYYDINHYINNNLFKNEVEEIQLSLINYHNISKELKVSDWCKNNKGAKFVSERGNAWRNYISHSELVFNVQRPYATTIHKAQGSEFDKVFIHQNDIKKSVRNGYFEQYARLMYVALSRAIHQVIIISD